MQRETTDKKTLAVAAVYDRDGVIDDYLVFYLASLREVADRLIAAVNGELSAAGRERLMTVADEIYCRPNTGFDFGAYKDVLENHLKPGELEQYQELVLCNDTCYGPFVPFADIFARMREKGPEFWSINYIEDPLFPHFQSYFMVFGGRAVGLLSDFLEREVDGGITNPILACGYEHGLSECILSGGIRTDYYTSREKGYHDLDIFKAPDYAMEMLGLPVLKRRAFSDALSVKDNCRRALCMLAERGQYPVSYILGNVKRIYHTDFSEALQKRYITESSYFEKNYAPREEVIAFCRGHGNVYLYGNGYMAALFMARFQRYMNGFGGYAVSDEYYEEARCRGERVYKLSQIGLEEPLIVAMTEKVAVQVINKVSGRADVLCLSVNPEKIKTNRKEENDMRKAVIYGTGSYYEQNGGRLPKDLEIVAYADSSPKNATSHSGELFRGLPVLLPEELGTAAYDVIYICTDYAAGNRIFQKLSAAGIGSDRIFFLNRMEPSADWKYVATEDRKGYLSTIDGIVMKERYLTDFDIVDEVFIHHSYGFGFEDAACVVIDIGMNVGIASLYFAKQPGVKKVYGFEAFPDTYEQAAANIALNRPGIGDKIEAMNYALSDESGKKTVAVPAEETGWRDIFSRDESKRQTEIVCRDAGEAVGEILDRHTEKIVLKIDTEGAEFPIFDALDRAGCFEKIDVIMMEYHGDPEKLLSVLKKYGYQYFIQGKKTVCGMIHAVK